MPSKSNMNLVERAKRYAIKVQSGDNSLTEDIEMLVYAWLNGDVRYSQADKACRDALKVGFGNMPKYVLAKLFREGKVGQPYLTETKFKK